MGWLNFISGNNKKKEITPVVNPMLDKIEVRPGVTIARAFADNWTAIEQTKLTYVSIEATPVESMKLEQSKFGHYPKIPIGFNYPLDDKGFYMYPLAQINFSEIPAQFGYPISGFLQFYISLHDEVYGINFEDNRKQENFRIHFFEEDEVENHCTDLSFLQEIMSNENSPVEKPHALKFSVKEDYFGLGDVRYENKFGDIIEGIISNYPDIKDDLEESLYEDFATSGHKINGYAYFTQDDIRRYNKEIEDYIILLQIDSTDKIMWGDCGVANFFIHPDDLAKKDFSKVVYNWDCS